MRLSACLVALFAALGSSAAYARKAPDCGLPEDLSSETIVSSKDLRNPVTLETSEQAQLIALARDRSVDLLGRSRARSEIRTVEEARAFLLEAFRDELYIDRIENGGKTFTVIYGWPGDNRGGSVFADRSLELVGSLSEDGLYCETPRTLPAAF